MNWNLADYVAIPRLKALRLSRLGRLVAEVDLLAADDKKYVSSLWELDSAGERPAWRLTRSAEGEHGAAFLPDGGLLFLSKRPDPDAEPADDATAALWLLPADGGEARRLAGRPGGIAAVAVARDTGVVVVSAGTLPAGAEGDDEQRTARKDADVSAILFDDVPVRFWDHDLGPGSLRLFAAVPSPEEADTSLRDLTPDAGRALDEQRFVVTPDGGTLVAGWSVPDEPGFPRGTVVAVDVASGERRVLAADPRHVFTDPAVSPDGTRVVCVRIRDGSYDGPPDSTLWLLDLATGDGHDLLPDLDRWPTGAVWAPDSSAVYFTADEGGRAPVFRVEVDSRRVSRLAADGQYDWICPAPDGAAVYALRSRIDAPPTPVRLDASTPDQVGTPLPAPGSVDVPGRAVEVTATAADGTALRAWLVLPEAVAHETPAPLLLWMHGGPLGSWNAWSWRWNPWLMAAQGYAVLLPDPALSTGYGLDFIRRGWGQWGGTPYTDLMTMTDTVIARPDIDADRTAAMGGSYGGYLANWVAGHTDRFRCIVTHASLWALDQFQGTTDHPAYWAREWGLPDQRPERYEQWSPHRHADAIRTPMLVIHGDKDYRVPIGEGLRLWWDLQRRGVESKFLYFPDENHWVLKPGNAQVWYETVLAWLATHLREEEWQRPPLL